MCKIYPNLPIHSTPLSQFCLMAISLLMISSPSFSGICQSEQCEKTEEIDLLIIPDHLKHTAGAEMLAVQWFEQNKYKGPKLMINLGVKNLSNLSPAVTRVADLVELMFKRMAYEDFITKLKQDSHANVTNLYEKVQSNLQTRPKAIKYANSPEQVKEILISFARAPRCTQVKNLGIFGHGDVGLAALTQADNNKNGLWIGTIKRAFEGMDCAMAPDARVIYNGCQTGRSCGGEDFMAATAYHLLKKGGKVKANYNISVYVPPFMPPTSPRIQVLTVENGLANPTWLNAPKTREYCLNKYNAKKEAVLQLMSKIKRCGSELPEQVAFNCALEKLDLAIQSHSSPNFTRSFLDEQYHESAISFIRGYWDASWLLSEFRQFRYKLCKSEHNN